MMVRWLMLFQSSYREESVYLENQHLKFFVAERKNFKLLFSAGIILPLGFQFIYFVQWEWLMPFCPGDLPDKIKGGVNVLSLSSSLTLDDSNSSNRPSQHEMSTFNFWASVPLGVYSFIIYSFLLDPVVLKTSRLDVEFRLYHLQLFSSMYDSQHKGYLSGSH